VIFWRFRYRDADCLPKVEYGSRHHTYAIWH
jgi:hypothetical protein